MLCLLILLLVAFFGNAVVADQASTKTTGHKTMKLGKPGDFYDSQLRSTGPRLSPTFGGPNPQPPGTIVGDTKYDYQHNTTMGRQIAYAPAVVNAGNKPHVHFLWMRTPGLTTEIRHIWYNSYNIEDNIWVKGSGNGKGSEVSGNNGGYCSIDVDAFGAAVVAWHQGPGANLYQTWVATDGTAPGGTFNLISGPAPPNCQSIETGIVEDASTYIWPIVEYQQVGSDQIVHAVAAESPPEATPDNIQSLIYYRWVNQVLDDPTCGEFIDSSLTTCPVVRSDPDPARDNVAIVYLRPIYTEDDPNNPCGEFISFQQDVAYIESTNGGQTWGAVNNITDYSQGGTIPTDEIPYMAFGEVSALYDAAGNLHIIWDTPTHDEDDPCQPLIANKLWHYDKVTDQISLVYDATLPRGFCAQGTGANMGAVAKFNISECDGRLYVSFTRFGFDTDADGQNADDCSETGYAAGDYCLTGSTDGGITWGPDGSVPEYDTLTNRGNASPVKKGTIVNFTNTWLDGCLADECHNENWGTMAKYSTGVLHIFYEDDNDNGSFISEEGAETVNEMMYTTYDCFIPEAIFDYTYQPQTEEFIAISPTDSTGCSIPTTTTFDITVTNSGNVPISYTVSAPAAYLTPNPTGGTITAGINTQVTVEVTVGTIASEGMYMDTISISLTSSEGSEDFDVAVRTLVKCTYAEPENALLSTFCWSIGAWNHPRTGLGPGDELGNMYWTQQEISMMYDEGLVITYADDPSKTYFSLFDGSESNASMIALTPLVGPVTVGTYEYTEAEFGTYDGVIKGTARFFVPTHPESCFVWERYEICNATDTTIRIHVGEGIDWDIPDGEDGVNNRSGADGSRQMVYQFGPAGVAEETYFGGAGFICRTTPGATVLENDIWVHPNEGYVPEEIGNFLATLTDFTASDPDSIEDLSSFYAAAQDLVLDSGQCEVFCKVKASTLIGLGDSLAPGNGTLRDLIDKGAVWPCTPGDANGSGGVDIDDVVYLIGYIFSGGPPPTPFVCCGDANGSLGVDIDDVVYEIGYIFSGGDPPVCSCCPADDFNLGIL